MLGLQFCITPTDSSLRGHIHPLVLQRCRQFTSVFLLSQSPGTGASSIRQYKLRLGQKTSIPNGVFFFHFSRWAFRLHSQKSNNIVFLIRAWCLHAMVYVEVRMRDGLVDRLANVTLLSHTVRSCTSFLRALMPPPFSWTSPLQPKTPTFRAQHSLISRGKSSVPFRYHYYFSFAIPSQQKNINAA